MTQLNCARVQLAMKALCILAYVAQVMPRFCLELHFDDKNVHSRNKMCMFKNNVT